MKYNITTEKNNKMDLYIRYFDNEEISISIYSINKIPSVKYELRSNLEEFQKNRFFKIFNNIEELILELDSKIEKTIILEETNLLVLDIPIGLKIINDILLEIKIAEKTSEEKIEELIEFNNKLKMNIEKLEKNIVEKDNKIEQILKQNNELIEENQNLKCRLKNYNFSYEVNFEEKKLIIEKYLSDLKNNNDIKIS
jgi:tellurite resistance protein